MNDLCAAAMRPLVKLLRPSVILRSLSGDSNDALLSYACTNNAKCSCEIEFARCEQSDWKACVQNSSSPVQLGQFSSCAVNKR